MVRGDVPNPNPNLNPSPTPTATSLSELLTPEALVSEPLSSSSLRAALRAFFWLTRAAAREGRPLAVALELPAEARLDGREACGGLGPGSGAGIGSEK